MTHRARTSAATDAGFTLVELLLAITIGALVLTGAAVATTHLVEADDRVSRGIAEHTEVARVIRTIVHDVRTSSDLVVSGRRIVLTVNDGTGIVYELSAAGHELHRITAASPAAAEAAADALRIQNLPQVRTTARGNMLDADYRATAVLQGVEHITPSVLTAGTPAATVGLKISIGVTTSAGVEDVRACAVMLTKVVPGAMQR